MTRRSLVRSVLLTLASGVAAVPVLGALLAPVLLPRRERPGFLPAARLDDLTVGVPYRAQLVSAVVDGWARATGSVGSAWLLKKTDGTVYALSSVCPHSGCNISWSSKGAYTCPCHTSAFSLEGASVEGPSPRSMDPLEVEVREKTVFVRHARFKVGVPERQET